MPIKGIKGGVGTKALGYGLGAAEEETEPDFNRTVLLLHGDGSEGEGNTAALGSPNYKAFKDNSTSAHALKVDADAYGNDFSPYYYADGYWSIATNTAGNISLSSRVFSNLSGDKSWTIEGWVYFPDIGNANTNLISAYSSGNVNSTAIFLRGSGQSYEPSSISLATYGGSNITFLNPGSNSIPHNEWFHFAFVRDSSNGNGYCFINGVLEQTVSFSATSFLDVDNKMNDVSSQEYYFSNFRIVDGTAVYTSAFTPSTAPLTAITNTTFLMGQSNRFIDNSSSPVTITPNSAGAKISTNTPFTQSKTANVGSGYFDGTDDHVETLDTSSDFNLGTDQFTIEAWVYTQSTDQQTIVIPYGSTAFNIYLHYDAVHVYFNTGVKIDGDSGSVESYVQKHAWNHVVVQRDSGNYLTLYVNGVRKYYTVDTTDFTANNKIRIGEHANNTNGFKGYIADVRFVKGSAVYSGATITVPTSSLTAVTNTKLLTCQYSGAVRNVGFLDDSKYNHVITRNGDVSMGTFSPFSLEDKYWSIYFNGNHPVEIADSGNGLDFGTGDFTIEWWAYETKIATAGGNTNHYFSTDTLGYFSVDNNGSNLVVYMDGSSRISSTSPTLNQWNHIAVVREGSGSNNLSYYLNGSRQSQASISINFSIASLMLGGQDRGGTTGHHGYFGYLSNFRILKGTALYSGASVTVPTEPLTAITNTSLLTCQSNRFIDNSTNGMAHTTDSSSSAQIQPFSPFTPTRSYSKDAVGGSAFFDGTGDELEITNSSDFAFETDDFQISLWVYLLENSGGLVGLTGGTATGYWALTANSGTLYFQKAHNSSDVFSTSLPSLNAWHFIEVSRVSGTTKMFIDGSQTNTASDTTNYNQTGQTLDIGDHGGHGEPKGYITNVRIIKGSGVTSSTLPTAPLTAVTNTKFLANFNNAGIIDHTMKNNLESRNNTRISGQQAKFGTGSIYFDGTTDDLRIQDVNNPLYLMRTGDWTLECFAYSNGNQGSDVFGATLLYIGGGSDNAIWLTQNSSDKLCGRILYDGSSWTLQLVSSASISHNTWYHVAFELYNGTAKVFINGTSEASGSFTADLSSTYGSRLSIGSRNASDRYFNGYLDEVRISRFGRYQGSNFTAPTKPFANR